MNFFKRESDGSPKAPSGATRPKGAHRHNMRQRRWMAAAVLLLAVIVAPSSHAQSDDAPRDTSYDADALAGWVPFLELAKSANGHPITDDMMRSRFGHDVKQVDSDNRGYRDFVDYKKSDGHGFDMGLSYSTLVHGLRNSGPGAILNVRLPPKSCLNWDKAKADLVNAGFVPLQQHASRPSVDHYFKDGGNHVELFLRIAVRARTPLQEMKYGPRAALICVA